MPNMACDHKSIKWIKTIRRDIAQHQFYDHKIPAALNSLINNF